MQALLGVGEEAVDPSKEMQPDVSRFDGCGEQVVTRKARKQGVDAEAKLTIPVLKDHLKKKGLSTRGSRADLLERARAADNSSNDAGDADGNGENDDGDGDDEKDEQC